MRNRRTVLVSAIVLGIAFAGSGSAADKPATLRLAAAPSSTKADPDMKEIANYKLTMDGVRKFAQANHTMEQLKKDHPELDKEDDDSDDKDSQSLDAMEAKLNSVAPARNAIEKAGLSVREYVVMTFALLQSGIAQYAIDQGADPAKVARDAGINPSNVTFYKEHKAEIEALNMGSK
jgi:hypothetical protein